MVLEDNEQGDRKKVFSRAVEGWHEMESVHAQGTELVWETVFKGEIFSSPR